MRKILYLLSLSAIVVTSACKKTKTDPDGPSKNGSTLDLVKDSVFLYAKEIYYWNDALPAYKDFKPRSFTGSDDLAALNNEVDAISQYKINPETGLSYEHTSNGTAKYSFVDDGSVSQELNGITGDFGFAPAYAGTNDLRVKYVYAGSPADQAGLKRGYQIISINGRTNLAYDGNTTGTNVNFIVNAYANSTTIAMGVRKPDGTEATVNLNVATYNINPVLKYQVYDTGNAHKVGYIVFNSFTSLEVARPKLIEAFTYFGAQNITDLVVDLRYNGGGRVQTAEFISNLIAPSPLAGSPMYKTIYTPNMANNKAPILANQVRRDPSDNTLYNYGQVNFTEELTNFSRSGVPTNLTLNKVLFIVTGSTASASELVINNLKAVMDVQLIGSTTYGKPVGFIDININKYQLYIPEFETLNSKNEGRYYAGMQPESTKYPGKRTGDDPTKEFGDPTEAMLAYALNYVKTGTFAINGPVTQSISTQKTLSVDDSRQSGIQLDGNRFNGMVDSRRPHKH